MLPIYPLDGGRIVKYILCISIGKKKALTLTNIITNITGIILNIGVIILTFKFRNIAYIFAMIYIWYIIINENNRYKLKRNLYKILENDIAINND